MANVFEIVSNYLEWNWLLLSQNGIKTEAAKEKNWVAWPLPDDYVATQI